LESTLVKHEGGIGKWILILGCPLKKKHSLIDDIQMVSGPTFAGCSSCEFERGKNFEFRDSTGEFPITVHLERLKCGNPGEVKD